MPLLQSTPYQLYKLQTFPMEQQGKVFVYFDTTKEFISTDAMGHKYGKMSASMFDAQRIKLCL